MIIIIGLGNPGSRYDGTFHNLGFMALDSLAEKLGASFSQHKYKSVCAQAHYQGQKVLLVKPQTFMNNSGEAVVLLKKQFSDANILVIVDDIDLPAGVVRYRDKGSSGTHNGMRSIVSYIGEDFARIRIGTGREEGKDLADFVLSKIKDTVTFEKALAEVTDLVISKISNMT